MEKTLYGLLQAAEILRGSLAEREDNLRSLSPEDSGSNELPRATSTLPINMHEVERRLMQNYEENPVFQDAIKGHNSIEQSLDELAQVNAGVRKFLPRRRNNAHNKRLEQLGALITKPSYLRTNGLWALDNFVTVALGTSILAFAAGYVAAQSMVPSLSRDLDPAALAQQMKFYQTTMPLITTGLVAPVLGLGANARRSGSLPREEAQYLDQKIQEHYNR